MNCHGLSYHAGREEDSGFDIIQCDIAGHLTDGVADGEDGVDLIELISPEAQLFSHARNIGIVQICAVQVVEKVHKTAESKNKEVELLHQLALTWRMLVASNVLHKAVRHDEGSRLAILAAVGGSSCPYVRVVLLMATGACCRWCRL